MILFVAFFDKGCVFFYLINDVTFSSLFVLPTLGDRSDCMDFCSSHVLVRFSSVNCFSSPKVFAEIDF